VPAPRRDRGTRGRGAVDHEAGGQRLTARDRFVAEVKAPAHDEPDISVCF
jgi:hypothetical protein